MQKWMPKTPRDRSVMHLLHRGGQCAVGAGYFGEEFAELGGVFDAGAGFDAAGDVNGIGTGGQDGFADVFRS